MLCWQVSDNIDNFLNKLFKFYLNNVMSISLVTLPLMPSYNNKLVIYIYPYAIWQHLQNYKL